MHKVWSYVFLVYGVYLKYSEKHVFSFLMVVGLLGCICSLVILFSHVP